MGTNRAAALAAPLPATRAKIRARMRLPPCASKVLGRRRNAATARRSPPVTSTSSRSFTAPLVMPTTTSGTDQVQRQLVIGEMRMPGPQLVDFHLDRRLAAADHAGETAKHGLQLGREPVEVHRGQAYAVASRGGSWDPFACVGGPREYQVATQSR